MRKIFIGSSSEGLKIAEKLKKSIEKKLPDFLDCHLWIDGKIFSLNKDAVDALVLASRKFDYGILVATPDDIRKSKGRKQHIPRDNVMFEMGMFIGSLGLSRAFLLAEKSAVLPTDYNGVTVALYDKEIKGSLEKAIKKIIDNIINSNSTFNLKPLPSAALALGHFNNFIQLLAKKRLSDKLTFTLKILLPKKLNNLDTIRLDYLKKHKSEEISVFDDGQRPRVYKLIGTKQRYWDIPSTLSTLKELIDIVWPSKEIGVEEDKQEWIEHELRNFKGTLEMLIAGCPACKESVSVDFLK